MKTRLVCAAAMVALAACSGQAGSGSGSAPAATADTPAPAATAPAASGETIAASDMPRQRVGLWRIAMNMGPGMPAINTQACVTQEMADEVVSMGRGGAGAAGADCDPTALRRDGDALVGTSTCRMQGQATTTRFRITGDLQSRYQMEVTNDTPQGPQTVRMDMTYAGPCSG